MFNKDKFCDKCMMVKKENILVVYAESKNWMIVESRDLNRPILLLKKHVLEYDKKTVLEAKYLFVETAHKYWKDIKYELSPDYYDSHLGLIINECEDTGKSESSFFEG